MGDPERPMSPTPPKTEACARCEATEGVTLQDSRTMYYVPPLTRFQRLLFDDPINEEGADPRPDPNAPVPLCPDCAVEHHQHWDDLWREVYYSR